MNDFTLDMGHVFFRICCMPISNTHDFTNTWNMRFPYVLYVLFKSSLKQSFMLRRKCHQVMKVKWNNRSLG